MIEQSDIYNKENNNIKSTYFTLEVSYFKE
jgi:hypothetical protein